MTEHQLQASIIAECNLRANQNPDYARVFAVPNGGHRSKATAGRLKAEGVRRGVPDLMLLAKRHGYSGLIMELKVNDGRQSPEQKAWLEWLKGQGFYTCVVRDDADKAMEIIRWFVEDEE